MSAAEQLQPAFETLSAPGDSREAWLARRRSGIGASEIAIVLGASGWGSILGLYYSKLEEHEPADESTEEYLQWGNLLQDAILAELARRAGVTIAAREPHLRSTAHDWMLATPDAITADGEPMECKTIPTGTAGEVGESAIPERTNFQGSNKR